jgi:hypothetical protein
MGSLNCGGSSAVTPPIIESISAVIAHSSEGAASTDQDQQAQAAVSSSPIPNSKEVGGGCMSRPERAYAGRPRNAASFDRHHACRCRRHAAAGRLLDGRESSAMMTPLGGEIDAGDVLRARCGVGYAIVRPSPTRWPNFAPACAGTVLQTGHGVRLSAASRRASRGRVRQRCR